MNALGRTPSTVLRKYDDRARSPERVTIGRLFSRFFEAREPEPPPLDATERQRLAHRKRAAERQLRDLNKTLKRIGCSSCMQQAPSRGAISMEQTASALRAEIVSIDKRLAAN